MKPSTAQPSRFFQVTLGCFPEKTTSQVHVQATHQGFYSIPNMGVPNKQMNFYWGWFISHIVVSVVVSGFHQDNPNDQMSLKISYIQKKKMLSQNPQQPMENDGWHPIGSNSPAFIVRCFQDFQPSPRHATDSVASI